MDARASASFSEQLPMTLRALYDGRPPKLQLPPDLRGNYRGNQSTIESDWVQFDWDAPVRIIGVGIEFHQDPNWIRPPADWKVAYQDANVEWQEVKGATYPTEPDKWLTIDFQPGTFKVEGRAAGQAAGYFIAEVVVTNSGGW